MTAALLLKGSIFNRDLSSRELDTIKQAKDLKDIQSTWGRIADWFCGSHKEEAKALLFEIYHYGKHDIQRRFEQPSPSEILSPSETCRKFVRLQEIADKSCQDKFVYNHAFIMNESIMELSIKDTNFKLSVRRSGSDTLEGKLEHVVKEDVNSVNSSNTKQLEEKLKANQALQAILRGTAEHDSTAILPSSNDPSSLSPNAALCVNVVQQGSDGSPMLVFCSSTSTEACFLIRSTGETTCLYASAAGSKENNGTRNIPNESTAQAQALRASFDFAKKKAKEHEAESTTPRRKTYMGKLPDHSDESKAAAQKEYESAMREYLDKIDQHTPQIGMKSTKNVRFEQKIKLEKIEEVETEYTTPTESNPYHRTQKKMAHTSFDEDLGLERLFNPDPSSQNQPQ